MGFCKDSPPAGLGKAMALGLGEECENLTCNTQTASKKRFT